MRIYLLNNTKPYRDGDEEYAGEWFNCPVDFEEVKEKLGVENEEQIEILCYIEFILPPMNKIIMFTQSTAKRFPILIP